MDSVLQRPRMPRRNSLFEPPQPLGFVAAFRALGVVVLVACTARLNTGTVL